MDRTPKLLVIDDEPDNFDVLETLLTKMNVQLFYAANGADGLKMLDIVDIDVILLDCVMPEMDGLEVCRILKSQNTWSMIPVVMVTSLTGSDDLANCLEAGADDFISKPINSIKLRARLKSMLRIRQHFLQMASANELQLRAIDTLEGNLNTLRGNFASTIPHEFNTPLMGILFSLELALSDVESADIARTRQLLDISYRSAVRLECTTQRFLRYATLESILETTEEQIPSDQIAEVAAPVVEKHGRLNEFVCNVEESQISISTEHLDWIVVELLDNAFKFSESGTRVSLVGRHLPEVGYELCIHDWGRGFTRKQIDSIGAFMQFERDEYEQQGSGLGLIIAIKTCRLYGGSCQVESSYGDGTTVRVIIPDQKTRDSASKIRCATQKQ